MIYMLLEADSLGFHVANPWSLITTTLNDLSYLQLNEELRKIQV
jgi:hypothetical protein